MPLSFENSLKSMSARGPVCSRSFSGLTTAQRTDMYVKNLAIRDCAMHFLSPCKCGQWTLVLTRRSLLGQSYSCIVSHLDTVPVPIAVPVSPGATKLWHKPWIVYRYERSRSGAL